MQNVLAIETSGAACAVGLTLDGNRFLLCEHVEKKHNERLLPMLAELTAAAGLSRQQLLQRIDAVAFGRGPGSFTGVRISAAAAQAMALAAGVGVLRVSSSELLAQRALSDGSAVPGVVTSIRSRRDLHYLAAWRNEAGVPEVERPDQLHDRCPGDAYYERYRGWRVVGERPDWWRGAEPEPLQPDADVLLTVALRCLGRGEDVDPAHALPEYLWGDSPWRKRSS